MDGAFEPRVEDHPLLIGAGNFQDDEAIAGAAWGVFVRSPHAFADIRGIDIASAQAAPGVLAVLTAASLDAAGIGSVSVPVPVPGSPGMVSPLRPSLARDCVRHVGDPVALVVAGSEAEALDAAELVEIDYAARDAVTDIVHAAAPEAPQIWPEAPGNIAVDWHPYGAKPEDRAELDRIFAGTAHIASVRLVNQRIVMAPMEPRTGVAVYESETDRYVLHVASQSAFAMRQAIARTMGVPVDNLRVVSRDVGGAFGMRTSGYPEYPAMLLAAKMLGRPVRWRSTRQEAFLTDNQARDTIIEGRLAMDADGKFLALDIDSIAALGAYHTSHGAFIATVNFARCLPCMYDIPAVGLRIKCVFTNTVPTGPYRGAGRPEANYCLERLVDEAARITGIDRIELRRRNLISAARMPYKTAVGTTYDSGDFAAVFDEALASADVAGFAARRATSETAGKWRGLGISCFLEIAGGQPGEGAAVAFPGSSKLLLAIGVQASGQGHRTVYRRLVADYLGIPADIIEVAHGDSDDEVPSAAAVASRSTMSVGGAIATALDAVIENGKRLAAHLLEAAEADIQYRGGAFEIAGTDRNITLFELAERAKQLGDSLDAKSSFEPRRLSPTASTSPRSRSTPPPGARRLLPIPVSMIAAGCCSRCWLRGRCRAGSRKASARRCWNGVTTTMRAASSSPARSWTTRCRAPTICPISSVCCTRCAARPTRSASRASARLVRRPRLPR